MAIIFWLSPDCAPTRWLSTHTRHVNSLFSVTQPHCPNPLCVFCLFVCVFTLQLSEAIHKALNTPSLCLLLPLSHCPSRLLWHFNSSSFNCAALSLLLHPYLSFFPTPIINTTFPQGPPPLPLVLSHLTSPPPPPLFPSLALHHRLHHSLSLSLPPLLFHIFSASLSIHTFYPICPPFIHLSFHLILTSLLLSLISKSPPCPPTSSVSQIHLGEGGGLGFE